MKLQHPGRGVRPGRRLRRRRRGRQRPVPGLPARLVPVVRGASALHGAPPAQGRHHPRRRGPVRLRAPARGGRHPYQVGHHLLPGRALEADFVPALGQAQLADVAVDVPIPDGLLAHPRLLAAFIDYRVLVRAGQRARTRSCCTASRHPRSARPARPAGVAPDGGAPWTTSSRRRRPSSRRPVGRAVLGIVATTPSTGHRRERAALTARRDRGADRAHPDASAGPGSVRRLPGRGDPHGPGRLVADTASGAPAGAATSSRRAAASGSRCTCPSTSWSSTAGPTDEPGAAPRPLHRAGTTRCGSTLLGTTSWRRSLGRPAPRRAALPLAQRAARSGTNSTCGCGQELRACPVWSRVLADPAVRGDEDGARGGGGGPGPPPRPPRLHRPGSRADLRAAPGREHHDRDGCDGGGLPRARRRRGDEAPRGRV